MISIHWNNISKHTSMHAYYGTTYYIVLISLNINSTNSPGWSQTLGDKDGLTLTEEFWP